MSLTSELDDRNGPVRTYFEQRFPRTQSVTRGFNTLLRSQETIRPQSSVPWGTLGTAFDYRARYYFGLTPSKDLVAWTGAAEIGGTGLEWEDTDQYYWPIGSPPGVLQEFPDSDIVGLRNWKGKVQIYTGKNLMRGLRTNEEPDAISSELVGEFFSSLDGTLTQMAPVGRRLEREDEEILASYCIVLGLFEEIARSEAARRSSPLLRYSGRATVQDLLDLPDPRWVDDLCSLSQRFFQVFETNLTVPTVLNPIFRGSRDVGGADADLILGHCLIEIKSTVKASVEKVWLYQLIGYALLDYDDEFGIDSLGFYMARQGEFLGLPIKVLLQRVMGQMPPPLSVLREEFQNVAAVSGRAKQSRSR